MRGYGWLIVILAALSAVLPRFDMQFFVLKWVDNWGEGVGWAIRAGLIVVGGLMIAFGGKKRART